MPTGYTAAIDDGISFKDFALRCARQFLIELRDTPIDAPLPDEFKVDDFYQKEVNRIELELQTLASLTLIESELQMISEYQSKMTSWNESVKKSEALEIKYKQMLAKVVAWHPPTGAHANLKEFMVSQINQSLEHDCGGYEQWKPVLEVDVKKWRDEKEKSLLKRLEYYRDGNIGEIKNAANRTKWVQELKQSLHD